MGNLTGALQQLRAERKQAQLQVEKLDQAISVIESLNGTGTIRQANQPTRIISQASRRKMAQAQRARWAKARKESQPMATVKTTASVPAPLLRDLYYWRLPRSLAGRKDRRWLGLRPIQSHDHIYRSIRRG
jgi:hypothetical protein